MLDEEDKEEIGLQHTRAGDLIALAKEDSWFSYYFWDDDEKAPEFARCIDIHRKHGYDPSELFTDPRNFISNPQGCPKTISQKIGIRIHMDLIPLDSHLVKG